MRHDDTRSETEPGSGVVPLIEVCPACATPVEGQKCKAYCPNEECVLYRRVIENCSGD